MRINKIEFTQMKIEVTIAIPVYWYLFINRRLNTILIPKYISENTKEKKMLLM